MEVLKEEKIIEVGMGEMVISRSPDRLVTRGLGSCVGITLYDSVKKTGAMAHAMLPDINRAVIKGNPARFVNYMLKNTVEELEKHGSSRGHLAAKIFGGAHMFSFITNESVLNVGDRNIQMAKKILDELNIKIVADETGGTFGRTIELNLENGKVSVRTVSFGDKEV